jgi:hypothetical protein
MLLGVKGRMTWATFSYQTFVPETHHLAKILMLVKYYNQMWTLKNMDVYLTCMKMS